LIRSSRWYGSTGAGVEKFERPLELSREAGDLLATPIFPGLKLRLADVYKVPAQPTERR
jgi:hypothetical protein